MKFLKYITPISFLITLSLCVPSCSSDDSDENSSIIGTWVDGSTVMTLDKNGNYRLDANDSYGQYRIGTYSYNNRAKLLVVNVKAIAGQNSAYRHTYIVQTLTSTTLVLLYDDGDIEGYYTRR